MLLHLEEYSVISCPFSGFVLAEVFEAARLD